MRRRSAAFRSSRSRAASVFRPEPLGLLRARGFRTSLFLHPFRGERCLFELCATCGPADRGTGGSATAAAAASAAARSSISRTDTRARLAALLFFARSATRSRSSRLDTRSSAASAVSLKSLFIATARTSP